jgi:hypothetical protein
MLIPQQEPNPREMMRQPFLLPSQATTAFAHRGAGTVRRLFIDPLSPAELAMLARISEGITQGLEKVCA